MALFANKIMPTLFSRFCRYLEFSNDGAEIAQAIDDTVTTVDEGMRIHGYDVNYGAASLHLW